jgi:hypothetical protein
MTRTRAKLNEARFFLGELERTYYEYVERLELLSKNNPEPPVCQYYLSAFISSARSIMWVMRSEYQKLDGWEEWYQSKKPDSNVEALLKKINAVRVRSEKQEPLRLGYNIAFDDAPNETKQNITDEAMPEWRGKRYNLRFERVLKEGEEVDEKNRIIEFEAEVTSFFWSIEDFPNEDILKICKSYFSLLETMVTECETRFDGQG